MTISSSADLRPPIMRRNPIRLPSAGLLYFPIPKAACSSLKEFFYEAVVGKPYDNAEHGMHVHKFFNSGGMDYQDAIDRHPELEPMAVVRDPVERLLSAYGDRVARRGWLSVQKSDAGDFERFGVRPDPDPDEFFLNIEAYRNVSRDVFHHTAPYARQLGGDLGRFAHIYRLEDMAALTDFLRSRFPAAPPLRRSNPGGPRTELRDLSPAARDALIEYARPDYDLLAGLYQPG